MAQWIMKMQFTTLIRFHIWKMSSSIILRLSKEQITVVKTTLRSINSTLLTVTENEKSLSKGLEEMAKHVNAQDGVIKEIFTAYSFLLTINEMPCN